MNTRTLITSASLLLLAAITPPAFAGKQSGTITFVGAIYETPCSTSIKRIECRSGNTRQQIDLTSLQQTSHIKTVSSVIHYQKPVDKGSVSIVKINYL